MDESVGKVCPFCHAEIKEGEAVKVCPDCGTPHHETCWQENKGCATADCKDQATKDEVVSAGVSVPESDSNKATAFCAMCGKELLEEQKFCSNCGYPRDGLKKNVCLSCGAELEDGQRFCPMCGQKVGAVANAQTSPVSDDCGKHAPQAHEGKNKKPIIIAVVLAVIVVIVLALVFVGAKKDFNQLYPDLGHQEWCTIAADGSYMKIDTNPYDEDSDDLTSNDYDLYVFPANDAIIDINAELGFPSALYEKMNTTSWSMGKQTDSNEKYIVSWTYHPDKGLEVLYEIKD